MIIVDLTLNQFKMLDLGNKTLRLFYTIKDNMIEMYKVFSGVGILYRAKAEIPEGEEGSLFREMYLRDAQQVIGISHVNENEWREAINSIWVQVDEIKMMLEEIINLRNENKE